MIKFQTVILAVFLITQGCGYKSIHKIEKGNYSIIKFQITGDRKITRDLEANFKKFKENESAEHKYELITNSQVVKKIQSKDSRGVSQNLTLEVIIELKLKEDGEIVAEESFKESANYANLDNKFELSQYEKIIIKNQTNKIINKINYFIKALK